MKRISEHEVEMTPFEGILHREFNYRLDQGVSVREAVNTLVDDLDSLSGNDLLHEEVDSEFWCWLSDTDRVFTALMYGEEDTRATAWFWQVDDVWVAVVGEAEVGDWWDGGKPPAALGVTEWQRPIYLWPTSGRLRWRDRDGELREEAA